MIARLATRLRSGAETAVSLTRRALEAASTRGAQFGAFVTIDADGALAAAAEIDAELADHVDRGSLAGIPVAVKDLFDTAGLQTTYGSAHFAGHVPDRDSAAVVALRRAGAIIIGKTTTHEFACGPTGDRSLSGASRNPHDPERMSGGSSGGSAVAVAAGIVPVALGTDTGGSCRIPAALCGVVGVRPTAGSIDTGGVMPLAQSLDTIGVLSAGPGDAAIVLAALAESLIRSGGPLQPIDAVGWIGDDPQLPSAPTIRESVRRALGGVSKVCVRNLGLPIDELRRAYSAIQGYEAFRVHADRLAEHPELFDPEVAERLQDGAAVSSAEYHQALRLGIDAAQVLTPIWREVGALALPTVPITAPRLDVRARRQVRDDLLSLTSPWSVLGLPAISIPAGEINGLPVGLQLVGPAGSDRALLELGDRIIHHLRPAAHH